MDHDATLFDLTPISTYTRAAALADGFLVDLSDLAREGGFRCPVAATRAVWALIETIPAPFKPFQDVTGRTWDLLVMARHAARYSRDADSCFFTLILATEENTPRPFDEDTLNLDELIVTLKLVAGPGDAGELVFTIMLPDES